MPAIRSRFADCHVFRRVAAPEGVRVEWLLMLRAPGTLLAGTWQMVQGHLEAGERSYQAALRELKEETGLRPLHFYQASYVNRFYLAATDEILLTPVFAAEVPGDCQVAISDEHTEHAWVTFEEALRRLPWPGQRNALRTVRDQFVAAEPLAPSRLDHLIQ